MLDSILEIATPFRLIVGLLTCLVGLTLWSRRRPANSPPFVPGILPWFGVLPQFARHPIRYTTSLWKSLGDIFTVQMAGKKITFLIGGDAHVPFFSGQDSQVDQNEPYAFSVPIFGPGVVYDVPQEMRTQQLKFLRKSLSLSQLGVYVPLVVRECEQFFSTNWGNEGVVNLRDELSKLIILTASRCLMGQEIREHLSDQVAQIFQELDEGLLPISVFWPYLPIPAHRRRDQARLRMVELFGRVMKERRENKTRRDDVLQLFMEAVYKTPQGERFLTDSEVAGLMIALLFAGQHTSSITSTWTGLQLLYNPQFLPPILEENKRILAECNGELNYKALNSMEYLKRAIKEALRLNPPLIFVMRKALVPLQYKQYTIPVGDYIFVSPTISHRDPATFSNPDVFDPDRFAPHRNEGSKGFGFIGFGGGRHSCMGESFAYLQITAIWSVLFRDFELEPIAPTIPEPDYTAMVVGPLPCQIRYRRKVPK